MTEETNPEKEVTRKQKAPSKKRGRKPKEKPQETPLVDETEGTDVESYKKTVDEDSTNKDLENINGQVRNEMTNGKYWASMIPKEFIVLNKDALGRKGINIDDLDESEIEEFLEGPDESLKLIRLQGFKEVLAIHGYSSLNSEMVHWSENNVVIKYTIECRDENNIVTKSVSAIASSNTQTTSGIFRHYMETIAENRAFTRAVKNLLCIETLGQFEVKMEGEVQYVDRGVEESSRGTKPADALKNYMQKKKRSFAQLKSWMKPQGLDAGDASSVEDLRPVTVLAILSLIKKD